MVQVSVLVLEKVSCLNLLIGYDKNIPAEKEKKLTEVDIFLEGLL